jgi:hypothetical protein
MSRAGTTTGGIGSRPVDADRRNLRAGGPLCDTLRGFGFALYNFLLMRDGLSVDAAVT